MQIAMPSGEGSLAIGGTLAAALAPWFSYAILRIARPIGLVQT